MSLYAFRPLMEMDVVSRRRALPILMYHSISEDAEPNHSPYYKTTTRPDVFAQHLRWLNDEGFRSVDLEKGIRIAQQGDEEHRKVVVITFDDGFRDFYDSAFPTLQIPAILPRCFCPRPLSGKAGRHLKAGSA